MDWTAYCAARAQECATMAEEAGSPTLSEEWKSMIADWIAAGAVNENFSGKADEEQGR